MNSPERTNGARPTGRRPDKIAYSVAREIISDVAAQGLRPGTVLESEIPMKDRYQVSRGSLREALRILEVVGFIYMKPGPGGGPILADASWRQFAQLAALFYQLNQATYRELLETRLSLEPITAALAAKNRTEADVVDLQAYMESTQFADVADDRQFRSAGQDFHDTVAAMSGNKVLRMTIRSCTEVFADRVTEFLYPTEARADVCSIHINIAKAIIDQKANFASDLMQSHLKDYLEEAVRLHPKVVDDVVQW